MKVKPKPIPLRQIEGAVLRTVSKLVVADTGDGSWAQLTDQYGISSERTLIQAGEAYDIETLTLEE